MLYLLMFVALGNPNAVSDRCGARYESASAALGQADKQIKRRRFDAANATLGEGLADLGDVATSASTADHTGLNLLHAQSLARRGMIKAAVEAKRRALATRLQRCLR